jgi:hypothetical protein
MAFLPQGSKLKLMGWRLPQPGSSIHVALRCRSRSGKPMCMPVYQVSIFRGRRSRIATAIFRFNLGMLSVLAGSCAAGVLF